MTNADYQTLTKSEALNKAIKRLKLLYPVAEISAKTGYNKGGISDFINGKKEPTNSFLRKFEDVYGIDLDTCDSEIVSESQSVYNSKPKENNLIQVPYYDIDFSGGWSSEIPFSNAVPSFIISNPEFKGSDFACNLNGNSISNRIRSKSVIGLKRVDNWREYFPTNELYALVMENELKTVKIVKRNPENKNELILIPDPLPEHNRIVYETEYISCDFVKHFFQVVAWAIFDRIVI